MAKPKRSPNAVLEKTADSFALLSPELIAESPAVPPPAEVRERTVTITVPLREAAAPRYSARHVEVQLDDEQATILTRITEAIDHAGERLTSGRRVASAADGIRWVLDQLRGSL